MTSPVSPRRVTPSDGDTRVRRSRRWWWVAAAVLVIVAGVALALFQPWRLFTRSSIDEASPVAATAPLGTSAAPATGPSSSSGPGSTAASSTAPSSTAPVGTAPTSTASGAGAAGSTGESTATAPATVPPPAPAAPEPTPFVDGEHATSGTAAIVTAADGRRYVRLENFSTSDGPDVHVILSDRTSGQPDWGVYDDGRWVELGDLKATDGNQNYEIPADVDLAGLQSVVIWCDRFDVAFGTAPLAA